MRALASRAVYVDNGDIDSLARKSAQSLLLIFIPSRRDTSIRQTYFSNLFSSLRFFSRNLFILKFDKTALIALV